MSQTKSLIKRMSRKWTTALDALTECGCMRLAARVLDMRRDGIVIDAKWVESGGKRYKAYRLAKTKAEICANK